MRILSRIFALTLCALFVSVVFGPEISGQIIRLSSEMEGGEMQLAPIYFEEVDKESTAALDAILFDAKTDEGYLEAITTLQNLIEQRGDSLIALDEEGSFLVNFAGRIFEKIHANPPILAAYRRRFDPKVCQLLAEARRNRDTDLLVKIWRDYRPSSHTGEALYELGTLALEQGDWGRAAWCLQRAATYKDVPQGLCFVRQAAALAEMGDEAGVRALLGELPADLAAERVRVGHDATTVGAHVAALADKIRHERKAIPDVAIEAVVGSTEIPEVKRPKTQDNNRYRYYGNMEDELDEARPAYSSAPYHARYAEGKICVVHESGMRVFDLDGKQLWHTQTLFDYATSQKIRPEYKYYYYDIRMPVYQEFPVIWGGRVFTLVPSWFEVPIGDMGRDRMCPFKIICMGLHDGKLKWMTGGLEADEFRPLHLVSFCTPPLCLFGRAYAVGYRPHPNKKSYIYSLYCLDSLTGRLLHETQLYQSDGILEAEVFSTWLRGRALMPSTDGARIFIASDDGSSMCVNAIDGRIEWAMRYTVRPIMDEYSYRHSDFQRKYWSAVRSVYADGIVLSAVADSRWLFAHDAETGKLLWKWDNAERTVDYIFDVRDSQVLLCGEFLTTLDLKTGNLLKNMRVAYPADSFISGRICASDTCLYWPTRQGIMVYDLKNFKLRAAFSFQTMAAARNVGDMGQAQNDYSGNLILADDRLVAVSARRITFYGPAPQTATEPSPDEKEEKEEKKEESKDAVEPDVPAPQ